jgi:predicted nucleic-acid-binding Zn-ribbon protein
MEKLKPKHCPNCGSANINNQEMDAPSDSSELYDTYCRDCEWSDDISPDIPLSKLRGRKTEKKEGCNSLSTAL